MQAISYRDNAGFVITNNTGVYRYVRHSYAREYDHLMSSGLYQRLVDEALLIGHTEMTIDEDEKQVFHKLLSPEFIDLISFPFEWSAGQWKEMILSFLKINTICLEYGMILKDATPFNFTFHNGSCIFFDSLSFSFYKANEPWIAYRQFCENMLGPFALICYNNNAWARMMQTYINGWPLRFVSANLSLRSWFNSMTLFHVHWHARYKSSDQKIARPGRFTRDTLLMLWKMLERGVQKQKMPHYKTDWFAYYETGIVSHEYLKNKIDIISEWMNELRPGKVIDLGANNGRFSILSACYAGKVIAVESDHNCIEQLRQYITANKITNIETIIADITQPTAGVGWNNAEKEPLLKRLRCDMLLALALIHHLCISANIPLAFVAEMFARLTDRYALVEFIPRSDTKVHEMLCNREDIFYDYTEENFTVCFSRYFDIIKVETCASSDRKLFLCAKK